MLHMPALDCLSRRC